MIAQAAADLRLNADGDISAQPIEKPDARQLELAVGLDATQQDALQTIIRDSQHLRDLAKASRNDYLAYLLESVLHEARATLMGAGGGPPAGPADPKVVDFKPR